MLLISDIWLCHFDSLMGKTEDSHAITLGSNPVGMARNVMFFLHFLTFFQNLKCLWLFSAKSSDLKHLIYWKYRWISTLDINPNFQLNPAHLENCLWKLAIFFVKVAHLRLFYGQRFKSHTFQVIFDPLKGLKAAIIQKTIKIYIKDCSREVWAKNRIYFLRGFQSLCSGTSISEVFQDDMRLLL